MSDVVNPFDARNVRPGAVPYHWQRGQTPELLLARLEKNGWRGQIVGPHGSGKSALIAALREFLERSGRKVLLVELHDGQRRLPIDLRSLSDDGGGTILIVDGYEQLSRWSRFKIKRFCRRRKLGLLVSSHISVGLPDVCRVAASHELAIRLVEHLCSGFQYRPSDDEIVQLLDCKEGNLRELLFALYDRYERRTGG